jgi:hypothetical protein
MKKVLLVLLLLVAGGVTYLYGFRDYSDGQRVGDHYQVQQERRAL